jgi:hypothetical protein
MKKGEKLKLLLEHWYLDKHQKPLDEAIAQAEKVIDSFTNGHGLPLSPAIADKILGSFIKGHQDPPHLLFYYFSRYVRPGVTNPAGRFGALDLNHAIEVATRTIADAEGQDPRKSKRIVLRLDFVRDEWPK